MWKSPFTADPARKSDDPFAFPKPEAPFQAPSPEPEPTAAHAGLLRSAGEILQQIRKNQIQIQANEAEIPRCLEIASTYLAKANALRAEHGRGCEFAGAWEY